MFKPDSNSTDATLEIARDQFCRNKLELLQNKAELSKKHVTYASQNLIDSQLVSPAPSLKNNLGNINNDKTSQCTGACRYQESDIMVSIVNRVEMNNFLAHTKRLSNSTLHDPELCKRCLKLEGIIKQNNFIKANINKLKKVCIDKEIDNHLVMYNSISLIGDLAANLPKPTTSADIIWENLLLPLNNSMN